MIRKISILLFIGIMLFSMIGCSMKETSEPLHKNSNTIIANQEENINPLDYCSNEKTVYSCDGVIKVVNNVLGEGFVVINDNEEIVCSTRSSEPIDELCILMIDCNVKIC